MVIFEFSTQYAAQRNAYQVRRVRSAVGVVHLPPEALNSAVPDLLCSAAPGLPCPATTACPPVLLWLAKVLESPSFQKYPPSTTSAEDRPPSRMGHWM